MFTFLAKRLTGATQTHPSRNLVTVRETAKRETVPPVFVQDAAGSVGLSGYVISGHLMPILCVTGAAL